MLLAPVEEKQGTTTIDPLSGKLTPRPTILSTPVPFVSFFPFPFLFFAPREENISIEKVTIRKFRDFNLKIFMEENSAIVYKIKYGTLLNF